MLKIRHLFSQIKKQQIINSTYEQLVERIARTYNLKQYKNESGLCLLQMHHQFQLFKPGDWVLDIGAGINYAWSDLALKLTQNDEGTNKVISNDVLDLKKNRQNNIFIKGDINEEPVQTSIALQLQNHDLDTILLDVSPQYSGNVNMDGRYIMGSLGSSLDLAQNFLKKGGNLVCKVLQSEAQPLIDETLGIYFNEKYKYVPSIVRKASPVCFYVMKGFLISQSYFALTDLIQNYKGTPDKKIKLVEKYQGKYSWDPVKQIRKFIFSNIIQMRSQGRPDKDIIKVFATDPYAKADKILKLLNQADQAEKDRNMVLKAQIMNKLTEGELFKNSVDFPTTKQQFYEKILTDMEDVVKENKQKKVQKRQKIYRAPLKQNQTYMKIEDNVKEQQVIEKQYLAGDLLGKYSERQSIEQVDEQIYKIESIHPQIKSMMNEFDESEKQSSDKTIEQILQKYKHKYDQLSEQGLRNIQQSVEQSVRKMSAQDIQEDKRNERNVYRENLNEQSQQKSDRFVNQRISRRKKPIY